MLSAHIENTRTACVFFSYSRQPNLCTVATGVVPGAQELMDLRPAGRSDSLDK